MRSSNLKVPIYNRITWTDQLRFIQEAHIVFGRGPHDLQLLVLNVLKFTLYFSVENCCYFLTVRIRKITPGNHKSVLENLAPVDVLLN